ncbi:hypothetical protein NC651_015484 [Populus alba x Populus x berolinensis]|nr:hypothetical protein NC651_015484 [Populus alba x Populus x berolinensis]
MLITPVKNKRPRGNKWTRIFEFKLLACFKHRQFMMILLKKYVPSKTLLILWKTISELVYRSEGFLICSSNLESSIQILSEASAFSSIKTLEIQRCLKLILPQDSY